MHGAMEQRLDYPMQLGSGTFDLHPGLTYLGQSEHWAWWAEAAALVRVGKNANDYRLGDRYELSAWGARKWADWVSTSLRLHVSTWDNIHGADPRIDPQMSPSADPDRQGGSRLSLAPGLSLYAPAGLLKGNRLALEVGIPIFQSLDGPQLELDWQLGVGWQWVF
jgi:hypothetical protein